MVTEGGWMKDGGWGMVDGGCWVLSPGCCMGDVGWRMLDGGCWVGDVSPTHFQPTYRSNVQRNRLFERRHCKSFSPTLVCLFLNSNAHCTSESRNFRITSEISSARSS